MGNKVAANYKKVQEGILELAMLRVEKAKAVEDVLGGNKYSEEWKQKKVGEVRAEYDEKTGSVYDTVKQSAEELKEEGLAAISGQRIDANQKAKIASIVSVLSTANAADDSEAYIVTASAVEDVVTDYRDNKGALSFLRAALLGRGVKCLVPVEARLEEYAKAEKVLSDLPELVLQCSLAGASALTAAHARQNIAALEKVFQLPPFDETEHQEDAGDDSGNQERYMMYRDLALREAMGL